MLSPSESGDVPLSKGPSPGARRKSVFALRRSPHAKLEHGDVPLRVTYDRLKDDMTTDDEKRQLLLDRSALVEEASVFITVNERSYECKEVVQKVCSELEPLQSPNNYCLLRNGVYLVPHMQKMRVFDILREGIKPGNQGGAVEVQLVVLPAVRAKRLALNLMRHLKNPVPLKKALHDTVNAVQDPFVAERCAEESGIDILKTILSNRDLSSNALAYALKALMCIVGTREGLQRCVVMARDLMVLLYRFLSPERGSNPTIYTSAAGALLSVCGAAGKDGCAMLSEAAALADDASFVHLVSLVADSNIPTATQCLLLVGFLVSAARPDNRLSLWQTLRSAGLDESLAQQKNIRDPSFVRARSQFMAVQQELVGALVLAARRAEEPIHKRVHELNMQPLLDLPKSPSLSPRISPLSSPKSGISGRNSPRVARSRSGSWGLLVDRVGIKRGACETPGCTCVAYVMVEGSSGGGPCAQCGHFPARHNVEGGSANGSAETLIAKSPRLSRADSVGKRGAVPSGSCRIIPREELQIVEELGVGTSATVYRGTLNGFQEVAVKVLTASKVNPSDFFQEMSAMAMFMNLSEYVVSLYGVVVQGQVSLVMEFCERGSLYHVLAQQRLDISWSCGLELLLGAARGLEKLHSLNMVHRDVKSLNFLVTEDWKCKIADLGLARSADPDEAGASSAVRGTILFCAPEVFQGMHYERSFDVYSFGIVSWEVLNRLVRGRYDKPYSDHESLRFDFQIIIQVTQNHLRPSIPGESPDFLASLVEECWHRDSNERPDMLEVCEILQDCLQGIQENLPAFLADTRARAGGPLSETEAGVRRSLRRNSAREERELPRAEAEVEEEEEVIPVSTTAEQQGEIELEREEKGPPPILLKSSDGMVIPIHDRAPRSVPSVSASSQLPKETLDSPLASSRSSGTLSSSSPHPLPKETLVRVDSPGRQPTTTLRQVSLDSPGRASSGAIVTSSPRPLPKETLSVDGPGRQSSSSVVSDRISPRVEVPQILGRQRSQSRDMVWSSSESDKGGNSASASDEDEEEEDSR